MPLPLFTNPSLTYYVPLQTFIDLWLRLLPLLPTRHALPNPDGNDAFPDSLAKVLSEPNELPPEVLQAFADIEALATPEKQPLENQDLDIDPDRPGPCRLRNAIHQWLAYGPAGAPQANSPFSLLHSSPPAANASKRPPALPLPAGEGRGEGNFRSAAPPPLTGSPAASISNPAANGPLRPPALPLPTGEGRGEGSSSSRVPEAFPANPPSPLPPSPSVDSCKISDSETFARLAALAPAEYDRIRQKEAKRLGLRVRTLDVEVARVRAQLEMEAQTKSIQLATYEPWPEPVDGAAVLSEILVRFNLYAHMPPGAAVASTLWTGHAPALDAFHLTPRLNLTSEFGGCGKTTVLDLIAALLSRALRFESLTPAVLFRIINLLRPVLLLDEVDTYLPQNDELRGLLNAGHKRNSHAYRCEGERYTIRAFKAFAPAVLAGIGDLPGTLRDRSIIVHMTPAPAGQVLARLDPLHLEAETILARKLARWAKDNFDALAACNPPLPPTAFNRLADNWRPLFAVAQIAGGGWPGLALDAFNHLTVAAGHRAQTLASKLLVDIRSIFDQAKTDRLFSSAIVDHLLALPNRPWPHANKGNTPINQQWLARRLLPLGISPHTIRIGPNRAKGYFLSDFAQAFATLPNSHGP